MNDAPIKTIQFGPGNDYIKASIWENKTEKGIHYHTIKLSHGYRDGSGKWHEVQTLYSHHLPLAKLATEKAYEFIQERLNELRSERKNSQQQDTEESEPSAPAKKRGQRKRSHADQVTEERGSKARG